jgi:Zn-dependent protease
MFGWAKPVPVSAWKFRDPRRGMALVAVAGPAMNFFLAWVAALLLPAPSGIADTGLGYLEAAIGQNPVLGLFLFYFILTNLVLGLFNLLPIPPLDGWHALLGLVDARTSYNLKPFEQYGFVVLILIIFLAPTFIGQLAGTITTFLVGF